LQIVLNSRFGEADELLLREIDVLTDSDLLDTIFRRAVAGASAEELRNLCK
jgi:hypothetical protein